MNTSFWRDPEQPPMSEVQCPEGPGLRYQPGRRSRGRGCPVSGPHVGALQLPVPWGLATLAPGARWPWGRPPAGLRPRGPWTPFGCPLPMVGLREVPSVRGWHESSPMRPSWLWTGLRVDVQPPLAKETGGSSRGRAAASRSGCVPPLRTLSALGGRLTPSHRSSGFVPTAPFTLKTFWIQISRD